VVLSRADDLNWLALRNAPEVHLLVADQLNTYDVLVSDDVVFTRGALDEFLGVPAEQAGGAGKQGADGAGEQSADESEGEGDA
jgi:large subunit ribosomal protein L4